ncbi:MAG: TIGR04282 family arsenosugar biosynthesis glycosyltransferase [Planctomycetota bacterium]|jgi:glycosyltransferase A (GT-A) superfamily protein (DUF2064 family)
MAKRPEPGLVKTRLAAGGRFSDADVVELAWAMLRCTARRLCARGLLVLAVSPDGGSPETARRLEVADCTLLDQGPGGLGDRMDRVWRRVGRDRPVAFFGGDSPDVPDDALDAIGPTLATADVTCGPTPDGGYWTLAARAHQPAVLREIDWGTPSVYDQTRSRAVEAGLRFKTLPPWPDVDRPEDVDALRERLSGHLPSSGPDAEPLARLADCLDRLCSVNPPREPR